MLRRRYGLILLLLVATLAGAQENTQEENDDWYVGQTIVDIRFRGLQSVNESELQPIIAPFIGQEFTERRFLDLQRRLYALDYFVNIVSEAVRPSEGGGVILRFTVTERPTADEVRFVGNRKVRTNDLLDTVVLKAGDMITLNKRRLDEEALRSLYLERGYPDVGITSRVEESRVGDETEYTVIFEISEGEQVTIQEIRFSGNNFASDSTLRGQMDSKAQNIFNSGVYQQRVLEGDRLRIERYYQERGYVDAAVVDIVEEAVRDEEDERTYLILTIYVEEGSRYTFGGIEFEGNTIFADDELGEFFRLREGDTLNNTRLVQGIQSVQDLYWQNGYIFNQFQVDEDRDEELLSIAYTMSIIERDRAHIEEITVRGNEKTEDYVILREIPVVEGDVFSVARIREGVQNLTNLQYFSAISPENLPGSVDGLTELVINVEEQTTADIRFGVVFGGAGDFPASGQIKWQDSNFLGRGQTFGVETQISPVTQLLSVNFLERWLAGRRWSAGFNFTIDRSMQSGVPQDILYPVFTADDENAVPDPYEGYYVFSEETEYDGSTYNPGQPFPGVPSEDQISDLDLVTDYAYAGGLAAIPDSYLMSYTDWSISLGANTGYRFRTAIGNLNLSTSLQSTLNYVGYEPTEVRPFDEELRANLRNWQLVNKWAMRSVLDRRRGLALSPSSGYLLSQGVTFAGGFLFGDRHYIRTDSSGDLYFTLWDVPLFEQRDWNWSWKMVLALHSGISFVLPTFWVPPAFAELEQPIAGADLLRTDGMFTARGWDPITGGEALWDSYLELRMPIVEQFIWLDSYFDAAAIWEDPSEIGRLGIDNMRFGFGSGVRFTIPQFPIRFYLTKRFTIDEDGTVQWQQGDLFNWNDRPNGGLDFVFSIGTDLF